jgi:hypothetical protein
MDLTEADPLARWKLHRVRGTKAVFQGPGETADIDVTTDGVTRSLRVPLTEIEDAMIGRIKGFRATLLELVGTAGLSAMRSQGGSNGLR